MTNQINNQSIIPSTGVVQLTLTLKMTTAQVVETSVTVNNNSPIQDYVHPDDQTQPFEMTPGFKPFTYKTLMEKFEKIILKREFLFLSLVLCNFVTFEILICYFMLDIFFYSLTFDIVKHHELKI